MLKTKDYLENLQRALPTNFVQFTHTHIQRERERNTLRSTEVDLVHVDVHVYEP